MPEVATRISDAAMQLFTEKGTPQVSITDLAQAAGVARGTIYNNYPSPEQLFEEIAGRLADEMHERVFVSSSDVADPAIRLAHGLRYFIKRAHEEPRWGRFILRFAFSSHILQGMWEGQPAIDVTNGIDSGVFTLSREQVPSILAMIAGTGLYEMLVVLEGHKTWRAAGSDAAELVLRALGVEAGEARRIAHLDLPPLRD